MARPVSDPTGRRLRNFVLLVLFAVALPSLLLTGFGLIAIGNERDAAQKRVHELYAPVVRKVGDRLKSRLQELVLVSQVPLDSLSAWGRRETRFSWESVRGVVGGVEGLGTNFFVLSADGTQMVPRPDAPLPSWQGFPSSAFVEGQRLEFAEGKPAEAAGVYHKLLQELPDGDDERCLVLNALGRSLTRAGRASDAMESWDELISDCTGFVDATGYNLALGARVQKAKYFPVSASTPAPRIQVLDELATLLTDPTLPASRGQVRLVAEQALALLEGGDPGQGRNVRERLQALVQRDEVLIVLSNIKSDFGEVPVLVTVRVAGKRQVFVVRGGETLAGFQLVPSGLDPLVRDLLGELEIDESVRGRIRPTEEPASAAPGIEAGSMLIKETDLTWRLALTLEGTDALDRLAESRGRLYFWALLLLVAALVVGIGRTVQIMIRETRLSRLKTDFVSSVSHELRTPLTSIRMFTETLLLGRVRTDEERRECLQTIGQETERLSRLVERILDFSRMEAGRKAFRFAPEPIPGMVADAVAACRPMIEEGGFEVHLDVPDDLPRPAVDRDAIVEVLINLLSNAIKYSPDHRVVDIQARGDDGHVTLSVRDRGVGVPRGEQRKIFEKFYRVDMPLAAEVSGSGLGLSLVQYIVRAHHGGIDVVSTEGEGSTFRVRLPVRPPDATKEGT